MKKYKTAVVRKEHFNTAHRLHNPNRRDIKNKEIFGKCNNPNFHGHNYDSFGKVIIQSNIDSSKASEFDTSRNRLWIANF